MNNLAHWPPAFGRTLQVVALLVAVSMTSCQDSRSSGKPSSGGQVSGDGGGGGVTAGGGNTFVETGGWMASGGEKGSGGLGVTGGTIGTGGLASTGGTTGSGSRTGTGGAMASGGSGAGGTTQPAIEYRGCDPMTADIRVEIFRIDRALGTCVYVLLAHSSFGCLFGLSTPNSPQCVTVAGISPDLTACDSSKKPADLVSAIAGTGTFSLHSTSDAVSADLTFQFPADGGLPATVTVQVADLPVDLCLRRAVEARRSDLPLADPSAARRSWP